MMNTGSGRIAADLKWEQSCADFVGLPTTPSSLITVRLKTLAKPIII